jgi:PII-like signaling protein
MHSVYLKFYFTEKQKHNGVPLHEWLLEQAKKHGVPGGSVFRSIAGYGRGGKLHEETFFELGGELPVQAEFIMDAKLADEFVELLRSFELNLRYVRYPVETGEV